MPDNPLLAALRRARLSLPSRPQLIGRAHELKCLKAFMDAIDAPGTPWYNSTWNAYDPHESSFAPEDKVYILIEEKAPFPELSKWKVKAVVADVRQFEHFARADYEHWQRNQKEQR